MVPGVRIYEVGISYYGRTFAEGKKIGWRDGFRAIYCILKYSVSTISLFIKKRRKSADSINTNNQKVFRMDAIMELLKAAANGLHLTEEQQIHLTAVPP